MRHAAALAASRKFEELPLPRQAATQLRLALDLLVDSPADLPGNLPAPIPLRVHGRGVAAVLQPRLAWPDRPARARMPDGSPAARRTDFYDWIAFRRRRAQIAARRATAAT